MPARARSDREPIAREIVITWRMWSDNGSGPARPAREDGQERNDEERCCQQRDAFTKTAWKDGQSRISEASIATSLNGTLPSATAYSLSSNAVFSGAEPQWLVEKNDVPGVRCTT